MQSLEHGAVAASRQQQQQQQQQEAPRKKKQQRRTGADNKQENDDDDDAENSKGLKGSGLTPEPDRGQQQTTVGGKSKYEATEPFRAKKGDRFS